MVDQFTEIAFMCPDCQAITGGGEYDEETLLAIEAHATASGLMMLRMWTDPHLQQERCSCPTPNAASRFAYSLSLDRRFSFEHQDQKTGKYKKGFPDALALPDLKSLKSAEDVSQAVAEIEEKTGQKVRMVDILGQAPPKQLPEHCLPKERCEFAFKVKNLDATFLVLKLWAGWKDLRVRIVEATYGYQVWPNDAGTVFVLKANKISRDELMTEVVLPCAGLLARMPQEKFTAWIQRNLDSKPEVSHGG